MIRACISSVCFYGGRITTRSLPQFLEWLYFSKDGCVSESLRRVSSESCICSPTPHLTAHITKSKKTFESKVVFLKLYQNHVGGNTHLLRKKTRDYLSQLPLPNGGTWTQRSLTDWPGSWCFALITLTNLPRSWLALVTKLLQCSRSPSCSWLFFIAKLLWLGFYFKNHHLSFLPCLIPPHSACPVTRPLSWPTFHIL